MLEVVEIRDKDESAWDEYVRSCEAATPFHLFGWKRVMESTYGYPAHYLVAKHGGRIEGVLPLFVVRSRLVGDYLTTLPRGLYTAQAQAARMLLECAKQITIQANASHLVIRDSPRKWNSGLVSVEGHRTAIRDLPLEIEAAWKSLSRETRRQVRWARKKELHISVGHGECLDDFYGHFSRFVRDVGTPVFSMGFLQRIIQELPVAPLIILVRWQGDIIGGYWALAFKDVIFGMWGGSNRKHLSLGAEYLAYWEHLRYGCGHGYRRVDFGRCLEGTGHYFFKKRWASDLPRLYQQYFLNGPTTPPDILRRTLTDPKYRLFTSLWKRLPIQVAEVLGPQIRRHVPFA